MDEEKQVKEPPVTYAPTLGLSRENVPVPQPAQREPGMSSTAVATVIKMIESLPEVAQDQIVEHLQEYIQDLRDESYGMSHLKRRSRNCWLPPDVPGRKSPEDKPSR